MFTPSQEDVRRFMCAVFDKHRLGQTLQGVESLAALWMDEHPQYHADLADVEQALSKMLTVGEGQDNPFLHLSMHLTISEQCSIDQPRGIRQALELLTARRGDLHAAHHEVMQELGLMIWESQRAGLPPDAQAYMERVQRRATRG